MIWLSIFRNSWIFQWLLTVLIFNAIICKNLTNFFFNSDHSKKKLFSNKSSVPIKEIPIKTLHYIWSQSLLITVTDDDLICLKINFWHGVRIIDELCWQSHYGMLMKKASLARCNTSVKTVKKLALNLTKFIVPDSLLQTDVSVYGNSQYKLQPLPENTILDLKGK